MLSQSDLFHQPIPKPIHDLVSLYEDDLLNLSPGFQRDSVWSVRDRAKLIDSIIRNYPLPAIFLYRRFYNGGIIYDVIDGKQRLESIFMFMGVMRGRYNAKVQLPGQTELEVVNWNYLCKKQLQTHLTAYKLLVIEVDGDLSDIIDLFVRINSTGKALTTAEKQHAKYYNSPFLKVAAAIARKFEPYFLKQRILSSGQISRMKHVELICELMVSITQGDVIHKKAALDKVMGQNLSHREVNKAKARTITAINRLKKMFREISRTRFRQLSDFYVLSFLIHKYESEHLVLTDRKRNKLAWDILLRFSNGVDLVREKHKRAEGIGPGEEMYREYLLTVLHGTDEISQRRKRFQILDGLLKTLFEKKDVKRLFSLEQRRLLWNTTEEKTCKVCKKVLSWEDFTIDHIDPHSRGGKTDLSNAAIMCRKHNSAKGNRRRS